MKETGPTNWLSGMRHALVLRFGAKRLVVAAVVGLMLVLCLEMAWSFRQQSQTFDEADHILAGYRYWRCRDFGTNPEHPPLVKLLASFPLLFSHLQQPVPLCGSSHPSPKDDFVAGRKFLYANDADRILFQTRCFAGTLTLILALLVFEAAREMFGTGPALLALTIFVFEPNVLANGTLVTTDLGATCWLFAAVFAFYRYVKKPGAGRLLAAGVASGFALAAKLSGLVIFPWLGLLALAELILWHLTQKHTAVPWHKLGSAVRQATRLFSAVFAVAVLAFVVLWALYGFRFAARPGGESILPQVSKSEVRSGLVAGLARRHLVPEAYYYGLTFQLSAVTAGRPTFLLGTLYPRGQWFYFPTVFVIKSTIGFLFLLLIAAFARTWYRQGMLREMLFLCIPLLSYAGVSVISGTSLGIRYILPIYPFLIVVAAAGSWALATRHRVWAYVVACLIVFHVASSLRSSPHYLAYSNEAWGGPTQSYRWVTDSNVDWGQDLKATKQYLDREGVKNCWFAYPHTADPRYYQISCGLLDAWPNPELVPETVEGTILISASELSGFFSGPAELNPYARFAGISPAANINGSVLVFRGSFDLPLVGATSHNNAALALAESGQFTQALAEAEKAVSLAGNNPSIQATLARVLARSERPVEARAAYQTAISLAQTVHPEFQKSLILALQQELHNLPPDSAQ